jgi:hypothetical protein
MALIGGSIPVGATFAPTGGTARSLTMLQNITNGIRLLINDSAAYLLRNTVQFTERSAVANASLPGGYSPIRRRLTFFAPKTLADGSNFVQQVFVEYVVHPESVAADFDKLISYVGCSSSDADFDSAIRTGSQA